MELTFGQNLAKERKQAGISQEELAEKLHLTRQTISKWETGASAPDVEGLWALCQALDVSADRLVEGAEREPKFNRDRKDLFNGFFYSFLLVMFVAGAVMRIVNHINIEIYSIWITQAANLMMLLPVVTFFAMAAVRLFRKKKSKEN